MKANELRIGNFVKVNDLVIVVNRIEVNKFWATHRDLLFFNGSETSPIPLTEEWLLKFGFETNGDEWSNYSDDDTHWGIVLEQDRNSIYYSAGEGIQLSRDIDCVHKLQNLYFALTGEELLLSLTSLNS